MNIEEILKSWESNVDESFAKASKDITKLVPVKKQVTKNGKTYLTTVYVSPKEAEKIKLSAKESEHIETMIELIYHHTDLETAKFADEPKIAGNTLVYTYHGPQHKESLYVSHVLKDIKALGFKATVSNGEIIVTIPKKGGASTQDKAPVNSFDPSQAKIGDYISFTTSDGKTAKGSIIGTKNGKWQVQRDGVKYPVFITKDSVTGVLDKKDAPAQPKDELKPEPKAEPKKPEPKGKIPAADINKHLRPIRKALGTEKYKEYLKAHGIKWEENKENAGADTMRASAAAKKFLEGGGQLDKELFNHMSKGGSVEEFKKQKEEAEAKAKEEAEAKKKAEEEAKKKAEEEAKKKAEEEAKKKDEPKGKKPAVDINKQLRPIRKALGTAKYKEYLKAHGIKWEANKENEGADTMRASAAAKKFLESGGTLDEGLLNHMKKGGSVDDYKGKIGEDSKADEPASKPAEKEEKKEEPSVDEGNFFKPLYEEIPEIKSKIDSYKIKVQKKPELKEFYEGLKEVATQEDFNKLVKAKGTPETKDNFFNLTWEMKTFMDAKKGTFAVKGFNYGFGSSVEALGATLNSNKTKLKGKQYSAVNDYTGSGYATLNSYLRNLGLGKKQKKDEEIEEKAKTLDSVLLNNETTTNIMLFRGLKSSGTHLAAMVEDIKKGNAKDHIGTKIIDHGFASTTIKAGKAFSGDVQLHIKAPKGTKGMYIKDYSNFSHEEEFLLPRGTCFVVDEIRVTNGQVHLLVSIAKQ